MALDQRLEFFLDDLDQSLRPIPMSERLEILTKIRREIQEQLERTPPSSVDQILAGYGSVSDLATRFRREKGLSPAKYPMRPGVKWFLIIMALLILFVPACVGTLIWNLARNISVHEDGHTMRFFSGTIDLDDLEKDLEKHFRNFDWDSSESRRVEGELPVADANHPPRVIVNFRNGRMRLETSDSSKIEWRCRFGKKTVELPSKQSSEEVELDMSTVPGANCNLSIPPKTALVMEGDNGQAEIHEPKFSVDLKMSNGSVSIAPDVDSKYQYEMKVRNGRVDDFQSDKEDEALKIKVSLTNGRIEKR